MMQTPAAVWLATSVMAGSACRAETSLMISAPAAIASRATAAFVVSMDRGIRSRPASNSNTGSTRRNSSAASMGWLYGRVLSPPTSSRSAPSSASRSA